MNELRFDFFLAAGQDLESTQYRIMSGLQDVRRAFSSNIIYPYLSDLVGLHQSLQQMVQQLHAFRDVLPRKIKEVDLESGQIVYERADLGGGQVNFMEDLIAWALPHIEAAIEEGRAIFEFVEENLQLEEVGVIPSYVEAGYLLLPDPANRRLHVLRYDLSIITQAEERFRTLKTAHVKSIPVGGVIPPPQSVKLELLEEHRTLPNPATYYFGTDLDFPYEQTMLPVAKRKLMRYLAHRTGLA